MAYPLFNPRTPPRTEVLRPLMRPLAPTGGYDSSGINPNGMYTGGNLPAQQVPHMTTGGALPPQQMINTPAGPVPAPAPVPGTTVPPTGGPLPPQALPGTTINPATGKPNTGISNILSTLWGSLDPGTGADPAQMANDYMATILGEDSPYMRSARQHGMEVANSRGLLNSSIAAGASERAAVDAAQPMFSAAYGLGAQRENNTFQGAMDRFNAGMGLLGQRENNAFQGDQAQRERQLKVKLQSDSAFQQDWLQSRDFSRQFNAGLAMLPIQSATDFMKNIEQYAIENPEVYTPDMISGMTAFFSQNMAAILQKYFPNLKGGT